MKPTAYIETSVVSYLTSRPSRDIVTAAYQQVTREWWRNAFDRFRLVASQFVVDEAGAGDKNAARRRLASLENIALLDVTQAVDGLAQELIGQQAVPGNAAADATHIAVAVVNGVDFLVTWNFRRIANAEMRARIESVCRSVGYKPAVICTPSELMESSDADIAD